MESEPRADAISEEIAEFLELTVVSIKDQNSTELGTLMSDSESITWQTVPPIMDNPKIIRWRSIIRATGSPRSISKLACEWRNWNCSWYGHKYGATQLG
jgi:hypothetical protein